MSTTYTQLSLGAQASLKYSGTAKKVYVRSLSWSILGPHLAIRSRHGDLTTRRHSCIPHRWYICSMHKWIFLNALTSQLAAIESLHNQHYIHHDIKLGNIMISVDSLSPISFLIDFGLAQQYHNPATYQHTLYNPHDKVVSTLVFSAIMGQKGATQSCHDNLESFAYTIIYSACRELPWSDCHNPKAVLAKKLGTPFNKLCQGLPDHFCDFLLYAQQLDFDKKPDYQLLHLILTWCLEIKTNAPVNAPPSVHIPVGAERTPVVSHWV